jgi:hypothetical protein
MGAGKWKLVDIASILATGHEAGVTPQGETREEAEKRFSTLLLRGDPTRPWAPRTCPRNDNG